MAISVKQVKQFNLKKMEPFPCLYKVRFSMMILMCTMSATGIRSQSTTTTIPEKLDAKLGRF